MLRLAAPFAFEMAGKARWPDHFVPTQALRIALLFLILGMANGMAQTIDTLVMGDIASEASHKLSAAFPAPTPSSAEYTYPASSNPSLGGPSDVLRGGLKQTARRLLPRLPIPDMYGGELNFTMKVDPVAQNYFTIKLWGSDANENALILNCENFEVGKRHAQSAADIFVNHGGVWFPNRFWYRTVFLPLQLTKGKQFVTIKLRSAGKIDDYNHRAYTPNYQQLMKTPSWQIYEAYTHLGGFIDTTGETEGSANAAPLRTTPGVGVVEAWKDHINKKVSFFLQKGIIPEGRGKIPILCRDIDWLAQTYELLWASGYHDPALIQVVIKSIDYVFTDYARKENALGDATTPGLDSLQWGGTYGPIGEAIWLLYPELKAPMEEKVEFGGTLGTVTREAGWSRALRASIDSGRYHRRDITNQEINCASNIYLANRGLELVDHGHALPESEALRYLYEAAGLSPFLGNDERSDGSVPVRGSGTNNDLWFGANWYQVTTKGTSKEQYFVGSDYGEVGANVYRMALISGDKKLKDQALKIIRVRSYFRFPTVDNNGFFDMMVPDPIGVRNNCLPGHSVYVTRDVSGTGASVVAHESAADLAGWFQEEAADGQLYPIVQREGEMDRIGAPYFPDDYVSAMAKAKSDVKLPQAPGAADFAWGDEENMVVAAKHGEERFFANMVWHDTIAINGTAMVFTVGPQIATRAEVQLDDIRYVPSGNYEVKDGLVDGFIPMNPPDNKAYPNVEIGNRYPIAVRPDLKNNVPKRNVDGGRGTGYTLGYGHWLIGMNGNYTTDDYTMKLPLGFVSGQDMVSGKEIKAPVVLSKGTTVVFYLPHPATIPSSPWTPPPLRCQISPDKNNRLAFKSPRGDAPSARSRSTIAHPL
jgi:hypothetical protein